MWPVCDTQLDDWVRRLYYKLSFYCKFSGLVIVNIFSFHVFITVNKIVVLAVWLSLQLNIFTPQAMILDFCRYSCVVVGLYCVPVSPGSLVWGPESRDSNITTILTWRCMGLGGVTNIPFVDFSIKWFFILQKNHVKLFESLPYLTGVTAGEPFHDIHRCGLVWHYLNTDIATPCFMWVFL